jgi:hypothetical protein
MARRARAGDARRRCHLVSHWLPLYELVAPSAVRPIGYQGFDRPHPDGFILLQPGMGCRLVLASRGHLTRHPLSWIVAPAREGRK